MSLDKNIHYTISHHEVKAVGEGIGIEIDNEDFNQIEHSIIKGIDAAIEDVRHQIIKDAIRSAQRD